MSGSAPFVHSLHVYGKHSELINRLRSIFAAALHMGNSVVAVATGEHRRELVSKLENFGVDVRNAARIGSFSMFDAGEILDTFMRRGRPDAKLFHSQISKILGEANRAAPRGGVTVFGEMVAVLWGEGNRKGALEVEELWNASARMQTFHLHCGYPREFFGKDARGRSWLDAVCKTHSHVFDPQSCAA